MSQRWRSGVAPGARARRGRAALAVLACLALTVQLVAALSSAGPASASVVYASDSFNRTTTNSWGTADVGGAWSASGPAYSVVPGSATLLADQTTPTNFLASLTVQDVDVSTRVSPAPIGPAYVDAGLSARYSVSGGTFYQLSAYYASGNNNGNYTVELKRKPSNTQINPDFNTAIPGGKPFWLRLQTQGVSPTALRWKIWADGDIEPSNWTATGTDNTPAMQTSGGVGVEGYASSGSATLGFGSFAASSISAPPPAVTCVSSALACDTFNRSTSNGWGAADLGGSWSGTGPRFGVTPGAATLTADATAPASFLPALAAQDADAAVKVTPPPLGGSYVDAGLAVRYQASGGSFYQLSVFYAAGNNGGNYTAELKTEPSNTAVSSNVNTAIPGGTAVWLRLQAQGTNPTTLRWKVWQDGSIEPGGWTSTATDGTAGLQSAGGVGLKAYANSGTPTVTFNGLIVNPITTPSPTPVIASCPPQSAYCDTFNRRVGGGWGSADVGGPWRTSGPSWSVTPGSAVVVADQTAPTNFLTQPMQDVDAAVKITPPGISRSYVDAGLGVRYTASTGTFYQLSTYYATGNNNGNYVVELKRKPDNTQISPNVNTSVSGGVPFWLRLQAQGIGPTTLRWKIWQDGTTEPTAWMGTTKDNTAAEQQPGGVGVESYVSAYTTTVAFNALWATTPPPPPGPTPFSCASGALACDTYARTVAGGWGAADVGGPWSITGTPTNWSVSAGAGSINAAAGAAEIGVLGGPAVQDVDAVQKVALPSVTQGTCDAYILGRYVGGVTPTYYRVGLIGRNGASVRIRTQRSDGSYVGPDADTGIAAGNGATVWLRVQFQGANSTAIRARAWLDGTQEPVQWSVDTTDSTSAMQQPGSIGVRVRNEDSSAAHLVSYQGFTAVGLPATPPLAAGIDADGFNRTLASTWGTANNGGAWLTGGTGYNVAPGRATIAATSLTPTNFLAASQIQDVDMTAWISPPGIGAAYVDSGIAVRYAAGGSFYQVSAYYALGNNNGNYTVQLKRKPANTLINADYNTTIPGGTAIWLRLQAQGVSPTTLRWKIWQDGTSEPSSWTGTATDSTPAMQSAGGVGVEAYANTGTATVAFNRVRAGAIN